MARGLQKWVVEAALETPVRVVILNGAGKAFCAGGDIRSSKEGNMSAVDDPLAEKLKDDPRWNSAESVIDRLTAEAETPFLLHTMGKPTIAKVGGVAAGAGMSLA